MSEQNESENSSEEDVNVEERFREPGDGVRALRSNKVTESKQLVHATPAAIMLSGKALDSENGTSLRTEWKTWKYTLQVATNSQQFLERAKHSLLVMRGGSLIQEIATDGPIATNEERLGETDEPVFTNLIKRIESRIAQAANANHDMARMNEATQTEKESIETFAKRLRELAKLCTRLAELALPNPAMSAHEIIAMGTRMEEREHAKSLKKEAGETVKVKTEQEELSVAAIGQGHDSGYKPRGAFKQEQGSARGYAPWNQHDNRFRQQDSFENPSQRFYRQAASSQRFRPYGTTKPARYVCDKCGIDCRQKRQCFAKDADCHNCGKRGHLARMCRSRPKREDEQQSQMKQTSNNTGRVKLNELSSTNISKTEEKSDDE